VIARRLVVVAVVLWSGVAALAAPARLELRTDRARYYGGATVSVQVLRPRPDVEYCWQSSVRGAIVERGTIRAENAQDLTIELGTPAVERIAPFRVQVEGLLGGEIVARGKTTLLLFPEYQPAGLIEALRTTTIALAGPGSLPGRAGIDYRRISSRMSLEMFEGDALLATGGWLDGDGKFLVPLIEEKVRRGLRFAVIGARKDWRFFPFERQVDRMPFALSCRILRPNHPIVRGLWYLRDCRGFELGPPEAVGEGAPCNLRILAEETRTGLPLIAEVFPPGDGMVLFVALPVMSEADADPAAPLLLERCLRYLARPAPPVWRPVSTTIGDKGGAAERLRRLGVKVRPGHVPLPSDLTVETYERLAAEAEGDQAVELTQRLKDRVQRGNDALILVGGAPAEPPSVQKSDPLTKGLSPRLLRRLAAGEEDIATELPDFGLKRETHLLVSGLLARIKLGSGNLYVLRDGYREGVRADEIRPEWAEFLSITLTNLGIRIEDDFSNQGEK